MLRTFGNVILIVACWPLGIAFGEDSPLPAPQDVIGKAINAHGGKKNLAAFANYRARIKGFSFNDEKSMPVTFTYLYCAPKSYRLIAEVKLSDMDLIKQTIVFNGESVWVKTNGITREGTEDELVIAPRETYSRYVAKLYPLLDKGEFTLKSLPASRINGKDAACVRVSSRGRPDILLFFDKKTSLLVKEQIQIKDNPIILQETYYEKYEKKKGIMCDTKRKQVVNGKKTGEFELIDIEPLKEVKPEEFSKP